MKKSKIDDFDQWYNTTFLCSRDPYSPIICSENRSAMARFRRNGEIAKMLLENPNVQEVREQVVVRFDLTTRVALDTINKVKLIINEYNKTKSLYS